MKITDNEILKKRNDKKNTILFAGATSFLGCRLAIDYLEKNHHLIFLVRSKDNSSPFDRLDKLFRVWDYDKLSSAKVTIFESRIDQEKLGLNDKDYNYVVEHTDEIVHSAANTNMEEDKKEEVQSFNIMSTRNLLKVATEGKAYFFHFMSTSYSCGTRTGIIKEEWVTHDKFFNPYEESKYIAEKIIIDTCSKTGIRYHIIRPSIVFGDSKTGKASRFNAFYYFVRTLDYLKSVYEKDFNRNGKRSKEIGIHRTDDNKLFIPLRIEIKQGSFFNIIPIDYFTETCIAILEDSISGGIYHIVNQTKTLLQTTLDNFGKLCNVTGLLAVNKEEYSQKEPNVIESLYQEYMDIYRPYFRDTKIFDDSNTQKIIKSRNIKPGQITEEEAFNKCVEFAMKVKYGKFLYKDIEKAEIIESHIS